MPATIIARTITIIREDDGSIRNVQGDMWQITDDAGVAITPKHVGTKNGVTAEEIGAWLPNADLTAQVGTLQAQVATIEPLKAQLRAALGTPVFLPSALLAKLTPDDLQKITAAASSTPETLQYYFALQNRAATTNAPIPIDSETFRAALAKLRLAVGDERVAELFASLNIALALSDNPVTGSYIDHAKAA